MNMKTCVALGLILLIAGLLALFVVIRAPRSVLNGESTLLHEVFPVFRQSDYRIQAPRLMGVFLPSEFEHSVFASGTGFLLTTPEGVVAITANHIVEGPDLAAVEVEGRMIEASRTSTSIEKIHDRVRLGVKSIRPNLILHGRSVDNNLDVTLMMVEGYADLGSIVFAPGMPKKGTPVTVYGFPSINLFDGGPSTATSNLSTRNQTITSIESSYFVIEGSMPITPGFSGGPVVDEEGKVVGLVVRSSSGQARCVHISMVLEQVSKMNANAIVYREQGDP